MRMAPEVRLVRIFRLRKTMESISDLVDSEFPAQGLAKGF